LGQRKQRGRFQVQSRTPMSVGVASTHTWWCKHLGGNSRVYRCSRCGKGVRGSPNYTQETCDVLLAQGTFLRFLPLDDGYTQVLPKNGSKQ